MAVLFDAGLVAFGFGWDNFATADDEEDEEGVDVAGAGVVVLDAGAVVVEEAGAGEEEPDALEPAPCCGTTFPTVWDKP
ncbi:MAG: hypothetical protein J2O48_02000 [Solirubrobacterales bacterium]|nr:hypothetical protein [Solirubrobacterales bacterium]